MAFTALSCLRAPSVVWALITGLAFLALLRERRPVYVAVAPPSGVGMLGMETLSAGVSWSPHYKVTTSDDGSEAGVDHIAVNGVPHQASRSTESLLTQEPQYSCRTNACLPATHRMSCSSVQVPGATSPSRSPRAPVMSMPTISIHGSSRSASRLIMTGVQAVSVETHIEDGRAFCSRKRYYLLLFLPDWLALVNGASAIRLESYLFTTETIETAREHLSPGRAWRSTPTTARISSSTGWPAP